MESNAIVKIIRFSTLVTATDTERRPTNKGVKQ